MQWYAYRAELQITKGFISWGCPDGPGLGSIAQSLTTFSPLKPELLCLLQGVEKGVSFILL